MNEFSYTYSAVENREVLKIRSEYLPRPESKLEELKRLDGIVHSSGVTVALTVGAGGCLLFGLGMCLAMEVIGQVVWLGVVLGLVGAVAMGAAFPIYRKLLARAKARYAPRILELAQELSGEIS